MRTSHELQRLKRISNAFFRKRAKRERTPSNVQGKLNTKGYLFGLNDECFFETRAQHFEHLLVVEVVADVLQNVAIRRETCTENKRRTRSGK